MSKPGLQITEEIIKQVGVMAGNGLTEKQIYRYYGISHGYWDKLKKENKELKRSFLKGKSKTIFAVTGRLMDKIRCNDLSAIIFYLKTQAGWREKTTINVKADVKSKNQDLKIETSDPIEASKIYQMFMTGSQNNGGNCSSK
jgi:hypothetical protein